MISQVTISQVDAFTSDQGQRTASWSKIISGDECGLKRERPTKPSPTQSRTIASTVWATLSQSRPATTRDNRSTIDRVSAESANRLSQRFADLD